MRSALVIGGGAYSVSEPIRDVGDYRAPNANRYDPLVIRANGAFDVFSSASGVLFKRSIREGFASAEGMLGNVADLGAIARTSAGLIAVETQPVYGRGYAGAQRLFLRPIAE